MAADIKMIVDNLLAFYDFTGKVVMSVGAGGGQLIEYARNAKRVYAVDNDRCALDKLTGRLFEANLSDKFVLIRSDFKEVQIAADVIIFEFCLHEMESSKEMVEHALTLANDVVIADHWIDSEWAFTVLEEVKVSKSWKELGAVAFKKQQVFHSLQKFSNYDELFEKVHSQGEEVLDRIAQYKGKSNIEIPMAFAYALV